MSAATATNIMTTNTVNVVTAKNKPIDPADFDVSKLRFGSGQPNKNGFTQYQIHYDREDTKDTKCIIKFSDVVVNSVMDPALIKAKKSAKGGPVAPVLDSKGQPMKPNYSLSLKITDPAQLKCLEDIESFTKSYVFKNKNNLLTKADKISLEDIENTFKDMLYRDDKRDYPLFSVSFPFGDDREPVEIKYLDKTVPRAIIDSTNPEEKIGRDSVVDVFVYLKNLKIDTGNSINIRRSSFSIVKVKKYVSPSTTGGSSSGKPKNGELIENVDMSKIDIGGIEVNKVNGKSIKPKIKYIAGDGTEKTKYISIFLPSVPVKFRKTVNKDDGKISFSACYEPSAEHLEKFKNLDAYFKKTIFDKIKNKEFKASDFGVKSMTESIWDGRFRGAVSDSNPQYSPSIWFSIYADSDPVNPDKFDFKGNFFNTDGTPYSNEEIAAKIIGERFTCDINIFLKHVWLGAKAYSLKYNVGNVSLDLVANEYDLGEDTYFEGEAGEADDGNETESAEGSPTNSTSATSAPKQPVSATQVEDSSEESEESEEEESDEDA